VLLTPQGPYVIDWCNTREGPPGLDCATSAVILAQVAIDAESEFASPALAVLGPLLAGLGAAMDFGAGLDLARARRGADPALAAREVALLDGAVALIRELRQDA
jgi:hypothetical protein